MDKLTELLNLTRKLVSFETTADNQKAIFNAVNFVQDFVRDSRLKVRRYQRNDKPSLLITLRDEIPQILLNGHIDVVSGNKNQFTARRRGGKIMGRGVLDMKGALSAMIILMKDLSEKGSNKSVGLTIVSDEEIGGKDGTGYLIEEGIIPEFFISGEPTNLQIGNEAKGLIWLKIRAKGKSSHASMPWLGDNANSKIVNALHAIERKYPLPRREEWVTTRNISVLRGGEVINKVPDFAEATFDIRYIPSDSPDKVITGIKSIVEDCDVEVITKEPAAFCCKDNPYIKKLSEALRNHNLEVRFLKKFAASDARYYTKVNIPAIVFGPGGGGQHSDDEYIEADSLGFFYKILMSFVDLQ